MTRHQRTALVLLALSGLIACGVSHAALDAPDSGLRDRDDGPSVADDAPTIAQGDATAPTERPDAGAATFALEMDVVLQFGDSVPPAVGASVRVDDAAGGTTETHADDAGHATVVLRADTAPWDVTVAWHDGN